MCNTRFQIAICFILTEPYTDDIAGQLEHSWAWALQGQVLFSDWLFTVMFCSHFQAVKLPPRYNKGRLLAYRLICTAILRRSDLEVPMQTLTRFYQVLHRGLNHVDQVSLAIFLSSDDKKVPISSGRNSNETTSGTCRRQFCWNVTFLCAHCRTRVVC